MQSRPTISRRRVVAAGLLAVPLAGLARFIQTEDVQAANVAVNIMNFKFDPTPLTIPVGTTVVWTNQDTAPHTATSDTAGVFTTPLLQKGQSGSVTFSTPGTFTYYCTVHPNMHGTVVVTAAGASSSTTTGSASGTSGDGSSGGTSTTSGGAPSSGSGGASSSTATSSTSSGGTSSTTGSTTASGSSTTGSAASSGGASGTTNGGASASGGGTTASPSASAPSLPPAPSPAAPVSSGPKPGFVRRLGDG